MPHEDVTRFKFVDETSVKLTYSRRYGRAPGGLRVDAAGPLHNGPNVPVVAARSAQGEAVLEGDGAEYRQFDHVPGASARAGSRATRWYSTT